MRPDQKGGRQVEILQTRLRRINIVVNNGESADKHDTKFVEGDKIKVPFQKPELNKFKRGTFIRYNDDGSYGYFTHDKSGKKLKRKSELIKKDND